MCPRLPLTPCRQYYSDLKRFLAYAMSHKDVWAVTTSQLLDWMEAPVPAAQMPRFMAKYTCPK